MKYNKNDFENAIKNTLSMMEASRLLDIPFTTFIRHAKKFDVYVTNQPGRGIKKKSSTRFNLHDILNGLHPTYKTWRLAKRLIKEGIKEKRCEKCGISKWNEKDITIELDHIDGDSTNHILSNLRFLCPNCHSQTENFRGGSKIGSSGIKEISDEDFIYALKNSKNISQSLKMLGLAPKGGNYSRAKKLMEIM